MSILSFGLTRYYSMSYKESQFEKDDLEGSSHSTSTSDENDKEHISNITFAFVYLILLLICAFFSKPNLDLVYTNWKLIDITNIIELGAGILLSLFMPGYAVVLTIKKNRMNPLLKVLLGYLFSVLITALTIYISAIYFDTNIFESKFLLIAVYLAILIIFSIRYSIYRIFLSTDTNIWKIANHIISNIGNKFHKILKVNLSELIVFGSLFGLLILSTYYLYGGITIGDQWYHQNRAIYFMYGNFKEFVTTSGDQSYPPFQSSLLAGLTSLSGVPLVNTYASVAFLNMTAVFAFYYFCLAWFPLNKKRAAIFASSLFVIASGFGWVYILYLTDTSPIVSQISSISNFVEDKIRVTDIRLSANFMIAAFPDFSTSLIYISLPAGFVLLGLIRIEFGNKISYTTILLLISILGILFHDEFYIFIIVSCILPLIYNLKKKSYVYFAFLIAFALAYIIDGLLPVKYFTSHRIFGISLIELSIIFTLVTLSLYKLRENFYRLFSSISIPSFQFKNKVTNYIIKKSFIPKILLVWIVVYLCALGFIVWSQLPANYVDVHTQNYNTPWYLYPMRLGVIGLFGTASILSYVFKKFEKEVFVFGIIIIIALLAGPYYNEQRFNKFVMVGMIGFASLMIYKLLIFIRNKKLVLNGIIIGSIVITASLSTLMYIGYNALVIETQDYTQALGRRNFPSSEEINILDIMRSKIQASSNHYNIATFPNEYNFREGGIISKLHAFSGLPLPNAIQTQYVLNASTLDSFYHLLELSNTGYIIIPNHSIKQKTLTEPMRFALENFPQIYKNDEYVVLNVPSLHGPSTISEDKAGIVYKKDKSFSSTVFDKKKLEVNNYTFNFEKDTAKFIQVQKENQTEKATLSGYKKNGGKTLWSKNLDNEGVNYIELRYRILDKNNTGKDTSGLKWSEGKKIYFVSLSNKGLELREQTTNDDNSLLLSQNSQVKKDVGLWYLVKIENLNNSINVYVDNMLKIKVPRNLSELNSVGVSKIGINSENNAVEFKPPQIGKIAPSQEFYDVKNKYDYYYPLSSLALSGGEYSSFADDDYSIFSNKKIILPFDPQYMDDSLFNQYLNYVRSGGTLVVINSDDKYQGRFSKLFSIEPNTNKTQVFAHITRDNDQNVTLNVSGMLQDIEVKPASDLNVIASYRNNDDKAVVPFVIEKHVSDKGRIIYINSPGYFDAIFDNPAKYFMSLANFSDLFELYPNKSMIKQNVTEPVRRFIGDVRMAGMISINGSSFSITNSSSSSADVYVKNISISDRYGNLKNHFENLSIVNIRVFGEYEQLINSTGMLTLPSTHSQHDYVGMSIPNEFNITIELFDNNNTRAEIVANNNSSISAIQVNNESKIDFYNVSSNSPLKFVPILVKNPEIIVNGNISFDKTNFYGQEIDDYIPLDVSGRVKVKFDFIDDFKEPYRNGTKIQHLSYLGSLSIDGKRTQFKQEFKLPGDISSDVKKRGLDVPLNNILGSSSNVILLIAISIATISLTWLIRRKHIYR